MATGFSASHADAILALIDGHYIQIHSGDPGAAGTANVLTFASGRALMALGSGSTVTTNRVRSNSGALNYTGAPAGTATHFSVWSAVTAGTFKQSGTLTAPKTLNAGDNFTIAIGDLVFNIGPLAA